MPSTFSLHFAAETGQLAAIDLYVRNQGADINEKNLNGHTPMYISMIEGQFEALELLLQLGADINSTQGDGSTALHWASLLNDEELVEYLIDNGANIESKDKNGLTPLQLATSKNLTSSVNTLLKNGANINTRDNDGHTPLIQAVLDGNTRTIKFLLGKGAKTEIKTKGGFTPLHWSILVDDTRVMRVLLENGSNIEATDDNGHTVLHRASSTNKTRHARILVENGSNVDAKGKTGKTPMDFSKTDEMIKILSKKNLNVLTMKGFDAIMQDDITVLEYLQDDPRNIVIIDGETVHLLNVRNMSNYIEDAIVFPCRQVGNISPENVETDLELYNMRTAGVIMPGYVTASTVRDAMTESVRSNKRVYTVSDTIRTTPAIVNQKVFEGRSGMVSANHCQSGADGIIRDILPINNVVGVPLFESIGDEFTEKSMSMIINAYIIVMESDKSSDNASYLKAKIISDAKELLSDSRSNAFKSRITDSRLVIEDAEHMTILKDLLTIFVPSITTIEIRGDGIEDFSFLGNVFGLKHFASSAKLNTWSAIQHLRTHHFETLESISIPVSRPILTAGGFPALRSLLLRDFDENDGVFDFIRGMDLENLTLVSRDYNKSLDVLSTLNLNRLHLSISNFDGRIDPVSNNVSLVELDLYLPSYTGSVSSLSILEDMVDMRITIASDDEVDTSQMPNLRFV